MFLFVWLRKVELTTSQHLPLNVSRSTAREKETTDKSRDSVFSDTTDTHTNGVAFSHTATATTAELPAKPEAPKGLLGAGPTATLMGSIEPPSALDDDDDDDDELSVRPLTMDELRQRVAASKAPKA